MSLKRNKVTRPWLSQIVMSLTPAAVHHTTSCATGSKMTGTSAIAMQTWFGTFFQCCAYCLTLSDESLDENKEYKEAEERQSKKRRQV